MYLLHDDLEALPVLTLIPQMTDTIGSATSKWSGRHASHTRSTPRTVSCLIRESVEAESVLQVSMCGCRVTHCAWGETSGSGVGLTSPAAPIHTE